MVRISASPCIRVRQLILQRRGNNVSEPTRHIQSATGPEARPTAILAIHRTYTLKPGLWRSVKMTPELLNRLVDAMTDQLGFTPAILGGVIADPEGKQVGVWYSLYSRTTIRFEPENVIVVSLPSAENDPFSMDGSRRPGRLH